MNPLILTLPYGYLLLLFVFRGENATQGAERPGHFPKAHSCARWSWGPSLAGWAQVQVLCQGSGPCSDPRKRSVIVGESPRHFENQVRERGAGARGQVRAEQGRCRRSWCLPSKRVLLPFPLRVHPGAFSWLVLLGGFPRPP